MTSADRLTLNYHPEGPDEGQLDASVRAGSFSGESGYWSPIHHLLDFERSLGTYPIEAPSILLVELASDLPPIIRIEVGPANSVGALYVRVLLTKDDRRHQVATEFRTSYHDIEQFRQSLRQMIMHGGVAILESTPDF